MLIGLSGCSSLFTVTSDPTDADVYYQDPNSGEKKAIGKTPLKMTMSEFKKAIGDSASSGQFFAITVEKKNYIARSFSIPATRFGTMVTSLDAKLKNGEAPKEARLAKDILDHIFLAQRLALSAQYERAQIELDKILADFPEFPRALTMRASIYFAQKNYAESLKWYEQALKADPQMEDAVKMAGKVRELAAGRVPASTGAPVKPPAGQGGNP